MIDIKYAGVDWLTMTTKEDKIGQQWYDIYLKYKGQRRREGNEEKQFHNGFYGGARIASMSVGHSDSIGFIVIVGGGDAERLFKRLRPGKHRVTRLDLAMDFAFDRPVNLAERLFRQLSGGGGNKQRKFTLYSGSDLGTTLYLGSRTSMQFGRLYDKGIEAGKAKAGLLWRAEVEYKKPMSGSMAKALWDVEPDKRELAICDTIGEWFAERKAELFSVWQRADAMHISVEQRVTTADRKLAWLRTQVAPTVAQLIAAGYGKSVLNSLLLDVETISKCLAAEA